MNKLIIIITVLNLGILSLNIALNIKPKPVQSPPMPITRISNYDIALECQKLSASTIDKFRMEDGKKVVFMYKACVDGLTEAIKSDTRTTLL